MSGSDGANRLIPILSIEQTFACAETAARLLTEWEYQPKLFDANVADAQGLRETLRDAMFGGALVIAPVELLDVFAQKKPLTGGWLEAIFASGKPTVAVPGGLDGFAFGSPATIPVQYRRRKHHVRDPETTFVRTDVSECAQMGRFLAEAVNQATGPTSLCLPLRGLSDLDKPYGPFFSMDARMALFGNLTTILRRDIPLFEGSLNANDTAFGQLCAETLLKAMRDE